MYAKLTLQKYPALKVGKNVGISYTYYLCKEIVVGNIKFYYFFEYVCKADITKIFRGVGKNVEISYNTYVKKY